MLSLSSRTFDYILVGGGLQNGLIALALLARPRLRVALVERDTKLGGNHVWCFHEGDVPSALAPLTAKLCIKTWPAYDVRFPSFRRRVQQAYAAVSSERLDAVLREAFAARGDCLLSLGVAAADVSDQEVTLADGSVLAGSVVIAATGPGEFPRSAGSGFQKFVGLEVELETAAPRELPLLMDAEVEQLDGFRFLYVLPFSAQRVLLEDTYFSDSPELDSARVRERILRYAEQKGYVIRRVVREESGVLPLPTRPLGRPDRALAQPLLAGFQGGWFHPTTGYSFPIAARLADLVQSVSPEALRERAWADHAREHRRQFRFYAFLNRLLFGCFAPADRYSVIERFYHLEEPTLLRFYAMSLTLTDRLRIFCGRPPRGFSVRLALEGITS